MSQECFHVCGATEDSDASAEEDGECEVRENTQLRIFMSVL